MHRKKLSDNHGMLFKFPYSNYQSFWMKNTYIPLDIAFLDDNGKILQIENMTPLNTRAISSYTPCKYALEVNKGWFKSNNISIGSIVGGVGINKKNTKTAQTQPTLPEQNIDPQQPQQPSNPDVMLNKTTKQELEEANKNGKDLTIIYKTKGKEDSDGDVIADGFTLPPKTISPPFTFEQDKDGHHDAIVKVWDNSQGSYKSLLIDNIEVVEEKEEMKQENEKPQEKDIQKEQL